jgi:hypothetical protein
MLFCFGGCAASRNGVRLEKKIEDGLPIKKSRVALSENQRWRARYPKCQIWHERAINDWLSQTQSHRFSLLASIYANLGATTLSIVTLGIMTLSKMTLSITLNKATLSITLNTVMVSVNILSVI